MQAVCFPWIALQEYDGSQLKIEMDIYNTISADQIHITAVARNLLTGTVL
jgi:hypothetical protein